MRWVKRLGYVLATLVILSTIVVIVLIRRPFPEEDGEIAVAGLRSSVEVIRDEYGIPNIYATSAHDLFMAQGYVHAQDRFWQMDFWRHISAGRLSEMLGEDTLGTDKFLRTLGITQTAADEFSLLDSSTQQALQAYADGVNAFLAENSPSEVSLEYALLPLIASSYEIEPWTPVHSLAWGKIMAWDLDSNMASEVERAILSIDIEVDRLEELYPDYPEDHPVIVDHTDVGVATRRPPEQPSEVSPILAALSQTIRNVNDWTGGGFEGIGSNNWAISGSRTESGSPIVANDPHLGIQMPSIWYQIGLHCSKTTPDCPYHVVGFGFPGIPGVVIGHNDHVAWGVTTQSIDTQDLYVEKINPADDDQYEFEGSWQEVETRSETIKVAGGDDVSLKVGTTRHGPLITNSFFEEGELEGALIDLPDNYGIALSWSSLEPSSLLKAILDLNRATGYEEVLQALENWDIAAQNVVFADTAGNIGYQSTGRIPIRTNGDGRWPVPGWTGEYEWTGYVPWEEMPRLLNPEAGFVHSANQSVIRSSGTDLDTHDGAYGYRASRIVELLASTSSHTVQSSQQVQMDTKDGGATDLVATILGLTVSDEAAQRMQSLLADFSQDDYQTTADSPGAAAYQAVWRAVLDRLFHDELPEEYWPEGGSRWFAVVSNLLEEPDNPWWDDTTTPTTTESRDDILIQSLTQAHTEITSLLGSDSDDWSWGELHSATFENQTFGQSGIGPIEAIFNRTAPPRVGGGTSIVNANGWDADKSYEVDWVPSMRLVVDLGSFDESTAIHTTGQSGHAYHRNYDDMIELWTDGVQLQLRFSRASVLEGARSTLRLLPGS